MVVVVVHHRKWPAQGTSTMPVVSAHFRTVYLAVTNNLSRKRRADRGVEVHVVGIVSKLERLMFFRAECYFHRSEELRQGEVLRPRQVEHL